MTPAVHSGVNGLHHIDLGRTLAGTTVLASSTTSR